ncbi:MAG: gamma-glutamyl-gamma-aminobutyrate hydrolase family protein [Anaerolineales bacterium]|jgi:putative glutamine amidotransferase
MSAPLIGITTSRRPNQEGTPLLAIPEAYAQALVEAGAAPLLIPMDLPTVAFHEILSRLDGVLLSGGGDIHPKFFGVQTDLELRSVNPDRDRMELHLVEVLVQNGLPFLGICRGIQTLNVALGGSLYLDIPTQLPNAIEHDIHHSQPRDHLAHPVRVEGDSRLGKIAGQSELMVNSFHHQAVQGLAPGLQATAYAPDGLVEALELLDHPFGLGVQWHPEWLAKHNPQRALFQAFVEAAAR